MTSFRFRTRSHINVQELLATRASVKHAVKHRRCWGTRIPFLVDSTVVCGAVSKGRSSSSHLNRILQGMLPYLLAARIFPLMLWIASAFNHADDGTRSRRLRARIPRAPAVDVALHQNWDRCVRARRFVSAGVMGSVRRCGLFLDVCSGVNSPLSAVFRAARWWSLPVDCQIGGAFHDLTDERVVDRLVALVAAGLVSFMHLAPPCSTFSVWMRMCSWSTRSSSHPWGVEPLAKKEVVGNACMRAAIRLVRAALQSGTPWSLENPAGSLAWSTPELTSICQLPGVAVVDFDWCQFGRPWRKRTRLVGTLKNLSSLGRRCGGGHEHLVLQGNATDAQGRSVPRTALAAEYSPEFSTALCDLALASPERSQLSADDLAYHLSAVGALTLLSGSQEKDLAPHCHPSEQALGPTATCESAWRTSQSSATPLALHL